MSEEERMKFDAESEKCMKTCSDALSSLKQRGKYRAQKLSTIFGSTTGVLSSCCSIFVYLNIL